MEKHNVAEIRHVLHALREPLASFSINLALLEDEQLSVAGGTFLKSMRAEMDRAMQALDKVDLILQNGASRPLSR